jgi:hypothetical protein
MVANMFSRAIDIGGVDQVEDELIQWKEKIVTECFFFHHQFNLVRRSVMALSDFSPFSIAVAEDRTVVLPTKFSGNYH